VVKKLLRPIVNRFARLLGVPQVQQRIDSLEKVVHEPPLDPAFFDLLERRIVDLAMARSIAFNQSLTEDMSSVNQSLTEAEERLVHLNEVTRL